MRDRPRVDTRGTPSPSMNILVALTVSMAGEGSSAALAASATPPPGSPIPKASADSTSIAVVVAHWKPVVRVAPWLGWSWSRAHVSFVLCKCTPAMQWLVGRHGQQRWRYKSMG